MESNNPVIPNAQNQDFDAKHGRSFNDRLRARLGVLPNLFCSSPTSFNELWPFAQAAYLENQLPSIFKERVFVYLSRFCSVRYCIVRHAGYLMGLGYVAGNKNAMPQTAEQVTELLQQPLPNANALQAVLLRLEANQQLGIIPEPASQTEADLFAALSVMFIEPHHSERPRNAVCHVLGKINFEKLTALLTYIHTEHYWTQTHPNLDFEPDVSELMYQHQNLTDLLLNYNGNERLQIHNAFTRLTDLQFQEIEASKTIYDDSQSNYLDKFEQVVNYRTAELKISRDLLQSMLNTSLISMSVLKAVRDANGNIQDFKIAIVNRALEKETGRTDLAGKLYLKEYPGIKPTGLYAIMLRVMETGQSEGTEYYYPHEGFSKWYSCMFVKMDDGLVATNLDITERKKAEEEQRKSLTLLQQSEEAAMMGSWDYDIPSGSFTWSAGMYRLFNLTKGVQIQPEIYIKRATKKSRPVAERILRKLKSGKAAFEETLEMAVDDTVKFLKVKATVIHDNKGLPVRVMGVDMDITATKHAEEKMLQDAALIKGIADAAPDMLYAIDIRTMQTVYINQKLVRFFDKSPAEINQLGSLLFEATVYEQDKQKFEENIQALRHAIDGEIKELTYRLLDGQGNLHWIKTRRAVYLRNDKGQPTHIIGVSQDVTEQLELQERNRQLRQERKEMEERRQQEIFEVTLTTQEEERKRIAESLHNGLGQILYGVKLSLSQINLQKPSHQQENERALQRTDHLLVDCISESRRIAHELMPTILEDFGLKEAIQDICRQLSGDISFKCVFIGLTHRLNKYLEIAIYRIVQELMMNVLKHSGATKAISKVQFSKISILITVEDNGKGFDTEASGGNGIGLQAIRSKVNLLSGKLQITSNADQGTAIKVRIPNKDAQLTRQV